MQSSGIKRIREVVTKDTKRGQDITKTDMKYYSIAPSLAIENQKYFEKCLSTFENDLLPEQYQARLSSFLYNNKMYYSIMVLEFRGTGHYEGKLVQGLLVFPKDFPKTGPKFFFGFLNGQEEMIQHENIYQSGELCNPVTDKQWKQQSGIKTIIESIAFIFGNPDSKSPANDHFTKKSESEKNFIRKCQNQLLEDWVEI